ncbi:MAG: hypothetical protein ACRCYE_02955 [Sarcina sp.]
MEEKLEVLETANEYLFKLKNGVGQLVGFMNEERESEACMLIPDIAEGIGWLLDAIKLTEDVIGVVDGKEILEGQLAEIVEALENQDFILVGDLFNYEVLPILDDIHVQIRHKILG